MLSPTIINDILVYLRAHDTCLSELILAVFRNPHFATHAFTQDIARNVTDILSAFSRHEKTSDALYTWAHDHMKQDYHQSALRLAQKQNGWHFSALHATAEQFEEFRIEDMAKDFRDLEPRLWDLVGYLLSGEDADATASESGGGGASAMNEDDYFAAFGDDGIFATTDADHPDEKPETRRARILKERQWSLRSIRSVVILSIIMQTINQQCNALGAINGLFFHACVTPDKVIKALAHMGVSISPYTINNAVKSLSRQSVEAISALGESLISAFAYDNFELKLHTVTPTIENPGGDLVHLTSGDVFQLDHGVTREDLRCSAELWATSPRNPDFAGAIGRPEPVECIPVKKLQHHPARTMEVNNSTVDGNISAIESLCAQAGLGCPTEIRRDGASAKEPRSVTDISDYVVLFHGDLGTMERVLSALRARSIEDSAWRRLQFVVFIPGLFHFKMACVDGIWRVFIKPKDARGDNMLMQYIGLLRPKETGKYGSHPTFRQMHEVVQHIGIILRLDAWRVEASHSSRQEQSLETWAAEHKPGLAELWAVAQTLARDYVPGQRKGPRLFELRRQGARRDEQRENVLLLQELLLLYEQLSWAMNAGDIGRVEWVLPSWIAVFKATGKHKYANHMTKFFTDLHKIYPQKLRHAIRYNILVNPKGKADSFRGVDWVEEYNNLLTKDTYGGEGSNYTVNRILTESPNILVYRSCIRNAERNYILNGLTTARGLPDMTATFAGTLSHMSATLKPNNTIEGRKSDENIQDPVAKGMELMISDATDNVLGGGDSGEGADVEGRGVIGSITADDLLGGVS
ncbi:uncharacterized protein C8Q71DRAFT_827213 [Rhodofomes roseus]|uniref:DUF6589 domain-containing protein n=1 Tax=Rhodofomes roseus TaxID=34475 RepID=A0ABQ8KUK5_9APHY|nr:uncharacterized protein C8Q71DRAFT_827213 [Rhodofomes roseus]KAH9842506.1 hypothetical protein C8Q71DRAFT_827213 [Rhodofomes roseus]